MGPWFSRRLDFGFIKNRPELEHLYRDNSLMEAPKLVSVESESSKHKAATCFNLQLLLDRKLDEQLTEARTCERIRHTYIRQIDS